MMKKLRENFELTEKMKSDLELVLAANDAVTSFDENLNKSI